MMDRVCIAFVGACALAACGPPGNITDVGGAPDAAVDAGPLVCPSMPADDFVLGVVIDTEPRRFMPFGSEECDDVEVQSGLQGGWHIEPAIQAPRDASIPDLGGEMTWRIYRPGEQAPLAEARFELFRTFWRDLGSGFVYWGDFVIFPSYPAADLDKPVVLELHLDFDENSEMQDQTYRQTVILRDDEVARAN